MIKILKELYQYKGYFVSDDGKIYCNLGKGNRRIGNIVPLYEVKPRPDKSGYTRVYMRNSVTGKREDRYIHRLVAENFIENENNDKYVNHINCIRSDNRVENLEWCDAKYNTQYTMDMGHVIRNDKGQFESRYNYKDFE